MGSLTIQESLSTNSMDVSLNEIVRESVVMQRFHVGDRVRIDIPDETDPDFRWHGEHGYVVDVLEDDMALETGDERDSTIYSVGLEDYDITLDARWRDLRPPLE